MDWRARRGPPAPKRAARAGTSDAGDEGENSVRLRTPPRTGLVRKRGRGATGCPRARVRTTGRAILDSRGRGCQSRLQGGRSGRSAQQKGWARPVC